CQREMPLSESIGLNVVGFRRRVAAPASISEHFRSAPWTYRPPRWQADDTVSRRFGTLGVEGRAMPTADDYRQMANRAAQSAIGCSAPSVARALLALALAYMALADAVSPPTVEREQQQQEMQEDPAGYGD